METRENKEFFIEASSCEEADEKIAQAIKRVWEKSVERFASAKTEEEKQNIVQTAMKRGCIPLHLSCEDEEGIYNAMKTLNEPRKISRKQSVSVASVMTFQNG